MFNRNQPEYLLIRPDTLDSIDNYVTKGWMPGDFLYAVLTNNLVEAVGRADSENLVALPAIVSYIYNEIPSQAWHSEIAVAKWLEHVRSKPQAEAAS